MSQRKKSKFACQNLPLSLENEISLAEPVSMKDNLSTDKFEALYSGRFTGVKKDENEDKTHLNVSKQQNDDITLVNNYLNQNTGDESPNFQNICSGESVRTDILIKEAKNLMGDKILLEINNMRTVGVARSQKKILEKSVPIIQTELAPNIHTKPVVYNPQMQQETIHPHYQGSTSNNYAFSQSIQYNLDTSANVVGRPSDEHASFNNQLQILSNENPGRNKEAPFSKCNFKIPERQQFTSLEFDYNLLAEGITPNSKSNELRENNWTTPTRFEIGTSSLADGREKCSEDLHSTRICRHGHRWSGPIPSIVPVTINRSKKLHTSSVKRKQPTPDNNPPKLKRKPQTSNLLDLEAFVTNSMKERHPSLSLPKNTSLKMVTLLLDIVQGIGDEANTLTTMTNKRKVDSRVLQYAIKLCLERMKNEGDVVTVKKNKKE